MIATLVNDRYRLDAELGRGGMGVVYRAYDTLLDRPVAFKVLNDTGLGAEGRAHLLHEAQSTARLNHPNIVSVHDAGEYEPSEGSPSVFTPMRRRRTITSRPPSALKLWASPISLPTSAWLWVIRWSCMA